MIIAGFDVSTNTVGWSVIQNKDLKITYIDSGYYKPLKKGSVFEKLVALRKWVLTILEKYNPDKVIIEDIIQFMKGKSTAKTIIALSVFNRTIGLICHDWLNAYNGTTVELLNVMTIRHAIKKTKVLPDKTEVPDLVSEHLGITFPWEHSKPRGGASKLKVENYDRADGIAVALAYALKVNNPKVKKTKKK